MYIIVYVDDLLIICASLDLVNWFKGVPKSKFTIHDLGQVKDFLGCQVKKDRDNRRLSISSIPKNDALLEKFGVSDSGRVVEIPMQKDFCPTHLPSVGGGKEALGAGTPLARGASIEEGNRYCELIGSLLYIANTTDPDIAQAVGVR